MSTLEVNTINPQSGSTITLGSSGNTVALGSGVSGSGFGKIGQVVSTRIGSSSWQLTTTQNTWLNYDDGTVDLELDITPSATSSKILLMVDARIYVYRATAGHHAGISTRFLHNETTAIHAQSTDGDGGWYTYDNANTYYTQNVSTTYLHSPASTSSQNYIFQMYFTGAQQFRYGRNYSTITAMEVLA